MITKKHRELVVKARKIFGKIKPMGGRLSVYDEGCFTMGFGKILGGKLLFWFEDKNGSSHIVAEDIKCK